MTASTIQNMVSDRPPNLPMLIKIADRLGVAYADLFVEAGLHPSGMEPLFSPVDTSDWRQIPILGTVHAGQLLEVWPLSGEQLDGAETITVETRDPQAFAVRVEGDSMTPEVRTGDIVIVEPGAEIEDGSIVLAQLEAETVIRIYQRVGKQVILSALNPAYPPIPIQPRQARGRVFRVVRISREL